ncbi:hypothetical protein ACTMU2_01725 [Cupriavidus basilensis]
MCSRLWDNDRVVGALCLRIDPYAVMLQILNAARFGNAPGELYVIDRDGRLNSPSRSRQDAGRARAAPARRRVDVQPPRARAARHRQRPLARWR